MKISGSVFQRFRLYWLIAALPLIPSLYLADSNATTLQNLYGKPQDGLWLQPALAEKQPSGPEASEGAVIYIHGRSHKPEGHEYASPTLMYFFAHRGWDTFRHNRLLSVDFSNAASDARILASIEKAIRGLRDIGYKRIVLIGGSRGAYLALKMGERDLSLNAIIAFSYGNWFGEDDPQNTAPRDTAALYEMLRRQIAGPVFLISAVDDPREIAAKGRFEASRQILGKQGRPYGILEIPSGKGGHGAPETGWFARHYGECLLAFMNSMPSAATEYACSVNVGYAVGSDIPTLSRMPSVKQADFPTELLPLTGKWICENQGMIIRFQALRMDREILTAYLGVSPAPALSISTKSYAALIRMKREGNQFIQTEQPGRPSVWEAQFASGELKILVLSMKDPAWRLNNCERKDF